MTVYIVGKPRLWAREGECVTCEYGHHICTVAVDIPLGAVHSDDFFTDWCFATPPKVGIEPPPCQCGGVWWWRTVGFHFEDGWR